MRQYVSEAEFAQVIRSKLPDEKPDYVTGPGRSGAIASVYFSHLTGVPFIPWGYKPPIGKVLVIDTSSMSGRTIRKAVNKFNNADSLVVFNTPGIHNIFWYESDYHA